MQKTFLKIAGIALCLLLGSNVLKAQITTSFHFGGAFPTGKFASSNFDFDKGRFDVIWGDKDKKQDEAAAGFGVNIGLKFKFDVPQVAKGFGIIATADLFFNPSNSDARDYKEDCIDYADEENKSLEISLPSYFNIPIMVGANYEGKLNDNISLFAEAAFGINFGKMTKLSSQSSYSYYDDYIGRFDRESDYTETFDMTTSFAFQVGAGLMFNDKWSLGVNYYSLGSQKINSNVEYEERYGNDIETGKEKFKCGKIAPKMFTIKLGYHF